MRMGKFMCSVALATAFMAGAANATTFSFSFSADGGLVTASGLLDVTAGQATGGTNLQVSAPVLPGPLPETMSLVTLSTPGVHDLGGGNLSYRFGGGTDLIGDTTFPPDSNGLVFIINDAYHDGFNIWSQGGALFAGFFAGDTNPNTTPGILYQEYDGGSLAIGSADLPSTPLPAALPLFASGLGALGLLGWRRKRKGAGALAA